MLKELTEDCFKTVISLIESGEPETVFAVISNTKPENCARLYVASLLLQNKAFPEKIQISRYSVTLNDSGIFFELYKAAACYGIGVGDIETLYNNSVMPEIIRTETVKKEPACDNSDNSNKNISADSLYSIFMKLGIKPVLTELKPGACPYSKQAKDMRKKGAIITSYKAIINGHSIILNIIKKENSVSYDINTFHCKDIIEFEKELKYKFLK